MHPMPAGFGEIRSHFACVNGPKWPVSPVSSVKRPGRLCGGFNVGEGRETRPAYRQNDSLLDRVRWRLAASREDFRLAVGLS